MRFITFVFAYLLVMLSIFTKAQQFEPNWKSLDQRPMPAWFNEAKIGIFIHWGVYSVPAYRPLGTERYASYAEWYQVDVMNKPGEGRDFHDRVFGPDFEYRQFAPLFKAELFNPDQWADLFQRAGAKYVVLTSKHHDGYCLWPSQSPFSKNWNSMEVGPKRDLVGELTTSVRNKGLKMGLYFSLLEWETPTPSRKDNPYIAPGMVEKYQIPSDQFIHGHIIPQLKELVTNYQPSMIFSDGAWDETSDYWGSESFLAWLYNEAPNKDEVVVNDRWGKDAHSTHGDFFSSEYSGDNDKMSGAHPWEESQGIGGSYGYNRAENLEDYKTSAQIIHLLIDQVSRGGNLLLNVGPSADGLIPVIMQQRLVDMGDWLEVNGEAIYGSTRWSNKPEGANQKNVYYTVKGNDLFVICTQWPEKEMVIPGLNQTGKVSLLGSSVPVKSKVSKGSLSITPPAINPGNMPCEHAWVFKVEQFRKGSN
jgi:alpha-L-fucosidase